VCNLPNNFYVRHQIVREKRKAASKALGALANAAKTLQHVNQNPKFLPTGNQTNDKNAAVAAVPTQYTGISYSTPYRLLLCPLIG